MAGLSGRPLRRVTWAARCRDRERASAATVTGAQRVALEQTNEAVARRVVEEIWNAADLRLADVLFGPRYANHGGIIPDAVRGPEAIKVGVALCRAAFPQLRVSVDALICDANLVELSWTARGTPPNSLRGTTLMRLVGGQIVESWTTWNPAGLLRRLGILPPAAHGGVDA